MATPCQSYTMVSTNQNYKTDKKFEFYNDGGAARDNQARRIARLIFPFTQNTAKFTSLFEARKGNPLLATAKLFLRHSPIHIVYKFSRPKVNRTNIQAGIFFIKLTQEFLLSVPKSLSKSLELFTRACRRQILLSAAVKQIIGFVCSDVYVYLSSHKINFTKQVLVIQNLQIVIALKDLQ